MSLEKVLALAHAPGGSPTTGDPAAELVAVALSGLAELAVYLASPDSEDDDKGKGKKGSGSDDDSDKGKGGGDHSGHPTFKRLKSKGMNDKMASAMCAKADNRVKATELCDAISVALGGLEAAGGDWVEATSFDPLTAALSDSKTAGKPYGDVTYADPGYRGKKRYPVDTPEHARAAWSYINQEGNAAKYSSSQLGSIKSKIRAALKGHGIKTADDNGDKVAASYVDGLIGLARGQGANAVPFHHGPMNGVHSHPHNQTMVHDHDHQHVNDNSHQGGPLHRAGSQPNRDW